MRSRSLVRIAIMAAVIAVLGLLPSLYLPFAGGVPITAQTLGVMLAGLLLGPRDGALAVLLFIFVVLLGAPLLAGGRGGLGVLFGPSVGFLLGFIPGAWATGLLAQRLSRLPPLPTAILASLAGGVLVIHACGILGLMVVAKLTLLQAILASSAFLPGDVLKAVGAGLVAETALRTYPALSRLR
jgi:biotin transport system substrate-specific component